MALGLMAKEKAIPPIPNIQKLERVMGAFQNREDVGSGEGLG